MSISKPFTFTAGTKARASEVNQDFDVLYSEVNSIDSQITSIDVSIQSLEEDKADKAGSTSQTFKVANPINSYDAVNKGSLERLNRIGDPIFTLNDSLPINCIWLDGSEVNISDYNSLYLIYGDTYGTPTVSGKFVLPDFRNKVIWGISSTDSFGSIAAGLPNITGWCGTYSGINTNSGSGALYSNSHSGNAGSGAPQCGDLFFDASRSNSIYGNSSTVQPPAIKARVYTRYQ